LQALRNEIKNISLSSQEIEKAEFAKDTAAKSTREKLQELVEHIVLDVWGNAKGKRFYPRKISYVYICIAIFTIF